MSEITPKIAPLRVVDLAQNATNAFDIRPGPAALRGLADQLGLKNLRKLRFDGDIRAIGKCDWQITAHLGASVVQDCVVTLAPVSTRIDRDVKRSFLANWSEPTKDDVEMREDETIDPLGSHIDLMEVMREALALALPLYPRATGADLEQAVFTKPGQKPMQDEDARPFAGLADLGAQLNKASDKDR
ncbi:MAG: DUF177 domain-containing protein [Rhodobacteraceae bacterium]|nr:DUF177 domain-containing protein [Paracoccaceae bacterium]